MHRFYVASCARSLQWRIQIKIVRPVLSSLHWPLSRRLDRCDRVIQSEAKYPFGGNVFYVTMQITFFTRKFRNGQRNLHCDVVHITTKWVFRLILDCNGVLAIKAYGAVSRLHRHMMTFRDVILRSLGCRVLALWYIVSPVLL